MAIINSHHIVSCINEAVGGLAQSVPNLCESFNRNLINPTIWTINYPEHGNIAKLKHTDLKLFEINNFGKILRGYCPKFKSSLLKISSENSIIHNAGIWMWPNYYAYIASLNQNIPMILSGHGMLENWSMQYHSFKKNIVWHAREKHILNHASALHATSSNEARYYRELGLKNKIYIAPHGVVAPQSFTNDQYKKFLDRHPELGSKRNLLFLSRIHSKKGIYELIDTWLKDYKRHPDWQLVIVGADLENYWPSIIKKYSLTNESCITYLGAIYGDDKEIVYSLSEILILPTHSENFGHVIGEALVRKIPVITTRNTAWTDVINSGCGWIIDLNYPSISNALREALKLDQKTLKKIGGAGLTMINNNYSWSAIGDLHAQAFKAILENKTLPKDIVYKE